MFKFAFTSNYSLSPPLHLLTKLFKDLPILIAFYYLSSIVFWQLPQLSYWNHTRKPPMTSFCIQHCLATLVIDCSLLPGFWTLFSYFLSISSWEPLSFISWFLFLHPIFCYELICLKEYMYISQPHLINRSSTLKKKKSLWMPLPDYLILFAPQIPEWLLFCFLVLLHLLKSLKKWFLYGFKHYTNQIMQWIFSQNF